MARPEIICLTNGAFAENCYLVADRASGQAVLVDPGDDADGFLARVTAERLTLTDVWLTHAHLDHVLGVGEIKRRTGVPIWLHPADRSLYDRVPDQARALLGVELPAPPAPDRALEPGVTLRVGAVAFAVRHAPGHSPGSVLLVTDGAALVGDVLFAGSVGRVDLPGGDGRTLQHSLETQILSLPDDTVVYPGHGPATTIGRERATNPFLTGAARLA